MHGKVDRFLPFERVNRQTMIGYLSYYVFRGVLNDVHAIKIFFEFFLVRGNARLERIKEKQLIRNDSFLVRYQR